MAKKIETLVPDIYNVLTSGRELDVSPLVESLSSILDKRLGGKEEARNELRMSNFGTKCDRKLWYNVKKPELAEALPAHTRLTFLIGDIIEAVVLYLAKEAGHKVEGEQDVLEVNGVRGHRDAVIDGVLVDVKSANSRSFDKFKHHRLEHDDPFGYIDQISLYLEGSKEDEKVTEKDKVAFLAVDKELGHVCLDTYKPRARDFEAEVGRKKQLTELAEPPARGFSPTAIGQSGNLKLGVECKYCPFKKECWKDSNGGLGLRKFIYSYGPEWLTKVVKIPDVLEVKV